MYRLVQRLVAIGNDAQNVYDGIVTRREAKVQAISQVKLSIKQMKAELDEIEKAANTLDYDAYYDIESAEVLTGITDKSKDAATILNNVDWSPTYLRDVILAALDSQPAVMSEAVNSLDADQWQRLTELRSK